MRTSRGWVIAATISLVISSACFDGTDHAGSQTARRRVKACVYSTAASGTYVGLESRIGWDNWRDVFRPPDMLVDETIVVRCVEEKSSAARASRWQCAGYSFVARSSLKGGLRIEGVIEGELGAKGGRIAVRMHYGSTPKGNIWMEVPSVFARHDKAALIGLLRTGEEEGEPEVAAWLKELTR